MCLINSHAMNTHTQCHTSMVLILNTLIFQQLRYSALMIYMFTYVLGSEKIRLMEQFKILGSALSPAETLKNALCLMKIDRFSRKIQSFKVESQHIALNVTCVFQTALLKNEILRHKPYFLRAYHICSLH